ncbi:MAG: hypothetical protein JHC95_13460 [Solirubrobacteraceae bacterium]|nr:hypothetical protein [Solirubrobacteraceae bacterium]
MAAAALALPAAATAEVTQSLDVSATPNKASTKSKKTSITVNFSTGTKDSTGALAPTTTKASVAFPKGSVWNGDLLPKCSSSSIDAAKSTDDCPEGSIVGSGTVEASAPGGITQKDVTIIAANGGKSLVNLFLEGSSPLRIQSNLPVKISKGSGDFGLALNVNIPESLQEPAPGVPVSINKFQVKVGKKFKDKKGKTRGLVEVNECKGGKWKARGTFSFRTHEPITVDDSFPCKKG